MSVGAGRGADADDFINFLVGGGRHPHVPGARLDNTPPAGTLLFEGLEYAEGGVVDHGWELTGDFTPSATPRPRAGSTTSARSASTPGKEGLAETTTRGRSPPPQFTLDGDHVSFLLGGDPAPTGRCRQNSSSTARSSGRRPRRRAALSTGRRGTSASTPGVPLASGSSTTPPVAGVTSPSTT